MTPATTWHPDPETLQAYVDGICGHARAASVEAHALTCAACRGALRAGVCGDRLARGRNELLDRIDAQERPAGVRLLHRLGLPEADARALLAAPGLRWAFWCSVMAAAVLALVVSRMQRDPDTAFLLLAPLLPLLGTAAAYAPGLDPAFPLVAATPFRTLRLLLARSLAVGTVAFAGVGAASLALPNGDEMAVVWLLPSIALTTVTLALAPRWGVGQVSSVVGAGWVLAILTLHQQGVDPAWVTSAAVQVMSAVATAAGLAALTGQWSRLDMRSNG